MTTVHKGVGHYGAPITLDQAKKAMAAETNAKQNNWNVANSIVDSGGHAVMLHRGHRGGAKGCPLSGVKRTSLKPAATSACDPSET
jgi:uncharacterized protein GlcG (DUF336 family)